MILDRFSGISRHWKRATQHPAERVSAWCLEKLPDWHLITNIWNRNWKLRLCLIQVWVLSVVSSFYHPVKIKNPNQTPCSLSSSDVQNSIHQNIYGKSLAITSTEAQLSTTIIENPEMLKYQQERQNSAQASSGPGSAGPESATPKLNSVMNGESLEDIRKVGSQNITSSKAAQRVNCICLVQGKYWILIHLTVNHNLFIRAWFLCANL